MSSELQRKIAWVTLVERSLDSGNTLGLVGPSVDSGLPMHPSARGNTLGPDVRLCRTEQEARQHTACYGKECLPITAEEHLDELAQGVFCVVELF